VNGQLGARDENYGRTGRGPNLTVIKAENVPGQECLTIGDKKGQSQENIRCQKEKGLGGMVRGETGTQQQTSREFLDRKKK